MKNLAMSCLLVLSCLSVGCATTETSSGQDQVTELFNGQSLSGWSPLGNADWQVVDGAIEARGDGDGFLVSTDTYVDYRLMVEFWVDETTNSGIFIGCADRDDINPKLCYEINIWDEHPRPPARTGAIVFEFMPPLVHETTVGKWNTYEITHAGSRLTVMLNGKQTAVLEEARDAPGFIALQHAEQGTVRFRRVSLSPM